MEWKALVLRSKNRLLNARSKADSPLSSDLSRHIFMEYMIPKVLSFSLSFV